MKFSRTQTITGIVILVVLVGAFAWYASQTFLKPSKPFVVVLPMWDSPPGRPATEGFVNEMKKLGYKEGVDIIYKRHEFLAPGPGTIEEIKKIYESYLMEPEGVDLIFTVEFSDTKAALEATRATNKPVPIVFSDLEFNIAKDWSSSDTNLTGVAERRNDVVEKALDLFITAVPTIKKIGIVSNGFMLSSEPSTSYYKALIEEAQKVNVKIVEYTTNVPPGPGHEEELRRTLDNIKVGEVDAWIHIPGHFFTNQQALEHQLALRLKVPHMLPAIEYDDDTKNLVGFFTYGADFVEKGEQSATFADKILRGGISPSEIPIEFPLRYKIMVNLITAKKIGVTVSSEILKIADMIVK